MSSVKVNLKDGQVAGTPAITVGNQTVQAAQPAIALDPLAQEKDFSHDEVQLQNQAQPPPPQKVNPPPGSSVAELIVTAGASYDVKSVERDGPHWNPIVWTTSPAPPINVTDGNAVDVELTARARISAWTSAPALARTPDASDPSRIAASWRALGSFEGLDDVTFIATVVPAVPSGGSVADDFFWAPNFLGFFGNVNGNPNGPADDGKCTAFLNDALDFFHSKGVQVFVSVYLDAGTPPNVPFVQPFVNFLRATQGTATMVDPKPFMHNAENLVAFFESRNLDIDGVSYDVEGGGLGASDRPAMESLYKAHGRVLGRKGRYLAYAGPASTPLNAAGMPEQPYALAKHPNVIVRTMSYDVKNGVLGAGEREKVIRFALTTSGLHPGQIQIGHGTSSGGAVETWSSIAKECANVHRKYRVGVVHWALGSSADVANFKVWNDQLNPGLPLPPQVGQPLQGPLNGRRRSLLPMP